MNLIPLLVAFFQVANCQYDGRYATAEAFGRFTSNMFNQPPFYDYPMYSSQQDYPRTPARLQRKDQQPMQVCTKERFVTVCRTAPLASNVPVPVATPQKYAPYVPSFRKQPMQQPFAGSSGSKYRGIIYFDVDGTLVGAQRPQQFVKMALDQGFAVGINTAGGEGYSPTGLCNGNKGNKKWVPDNLCTFMNANNFDTFNNINGRWPILAGKKGAVYKGSGPGGKKGYAMEVGMKKYGIQNPGCIMHFDDSEEYIKGINNFNPSFQTFLVGDPKMSPEAMQQMLARNSCPQAPVPLNNPSNPSSSSSSFGTQEFSIGGKSYYVSRAVAKELATLPEELQLSRVSALGSQFESSKPKTAPNTAFSEPKFSEGLQKDLSTGPYTEMRKTPDFVFWQVTDTRCSCGTRTSTPKAVCMNPEAEEVDAALCSEIPYPKYEVCPRC